MEKNEEEPHSADEGCAGPSPKENADDDDEEENGAFRKETQEEYCGDDNSGNDGHAVADAGITLWGRANAAEEQTRAVVPLWLLQEYAPAWNARAWELALGVPMKHRTTFFQEEAVMAGA